MKSNHYTNQKITHTLLIHFKSVPLRVYNLKLMSPSTRLAMHQSNFHRYYNSKGDGDNCTDSDFEQNY